MQSAAPFTQEPYRDRKRYAWIMSLLVPCTVALGPSLVLATGDARMLWIQVAFFYLVVPFIDFVLGEDRSNPPESAVPALEADMYYRWITYLLVPILWVAFIFCAWFVATHDLPLHGLIAMVLITGSAGGFCINLGHELGHKNTRLERWMAKIVLAPTGYGHFFIEHNRGHHRDVATPADPASSRMGESIYRFVLREMPGAFVRAWTLERDRPAKRWLAGSVAPQRNSATRVDHADSVDCASDMAGHWHPALPSDRIVLGQLPAHLGQLCRALRPAAPGALARQIRGLPAPPFLEQQPRVLQLGAVPFAAPLRPPCPPAAPLPVTAPL